MKKIFLILALTLAIASIKATAMEPATETETTVTFVQPYEEYDYVEVTTPAGEIYGFITDPCDYSEGDVISVIIDQNGTEAVLDDTIVGVK